MKGPVEAVLISPRVWRTGSQNLTLLTHTSLDLYWPLGVHVDVREYAMQGQAAR